jgi:hypothetical protein
MSLNNKLKKDTDSSLNNVIASVQIWGYVALNEMKYGAEWCEVVGLEPSDRDFSPRSCPHIDMRLKLG